MATKKAKFPFEASAGELRKDTDAYVDSVFSSIQSDFLVLPKGQGFVDYATFESGYEALKRATRGFSILDTKKILPVLKTTPIAFVVLRSMLGFTPPEWAYMASQQTGVDVNQNAARTLDRKARLGPEKPFLSTKLTEERVEAMVRTACDLLTEGAPEVAPNMIHRLDKADVGSPGTELEFAL